MVRISRLSDIAPDVASKLNAKKVDTQADLWEMIGPNFQQGIERVATLFDINKEQLHEILKQPTAADNTKAEDRLRRFFFLVRRHWGEVLALIIFGILLFLLILNAIQRRDTWVVSAPNGLPAFHVIEPYDVHLEKMFTIHDSLTSKSDVIGRYLLQPVSHNAVLLNSELAPLKLREQLTGRQVLTLPAQTGAISSTLAPGGRVRLLFSPRNVVDSKIGTTRTVSPIIADFIIDDVIVLSATRQADSSSITVALKNEDDLTRAVALLATSDVLIFQYR